MIHLALIPLIQPHIPTMYLLLFLLHSEMRLLLERTYMCSFRYS